MGRKIFISYKYYDSDVKRITNNLFELNTVRNYVDILEVFLKKYSEHIYKGESDDEDLSKFSDETIWSKLKDRIYDSSLTIVMISKNMREFGKLDRDQWIPWEIAYSLRETPRKNRMGTYDTSNTNAMLAIVIPDYNNSYDYYINERTCCSSGCRCINSNNLFNILQKNMFNLNNPEIKYCSDGSITYFGDASYINSVKWNDFIINPDMHINKAYEILSNMKNYNICKEV